MLKLFMINSSFKRPQWVGRWHFMIRATIGIRYSGIRNLSFTWHSNRLPPPRKANRKLRLWNVHWGCVLKQDWISPWRFQYPVSFILVIVIRPPKEKARGS